MACAGVLALTGCATAPPDGDPSLTGGPSTPSPSPTASPTPTPTPTPTDPLEGWSLTDQVGLLVMVGVPANGSGESSALEAISDHHVSTVFLSGRTTGGGDQVRETLAPLLAAAAGKTHGLPLLVATDQEGGNVQVIRGPGFETMPTALTQGKRTPEALRADAARWGGQLAAAGIRMDLAPVAGVVPAGTAASNPPIGAYRRQYGSTAAVVGPAATAFAQGLGDAGVIATVKHFPGLGRVRANTDTSSGVTDRATGPDSDQVAAFRQVVASGVPAVMMSSAVYTRIDPDAPAVFSATAVALLRQRLGFTGVIVTDDLSAAKQVRAWAPGERAIKAIQAGCDLVLATAAPVDGPIMARALRERAEQNPAFAQRVHEAATRVLAMRRGIG